MEALSTSNVTATLLFSWPQLRSERLLKLFCYFQEKKCFNFLPLQKHHANMFFSLTPSLVIWFWIIF
jgi:hypothetical protein